MTDHQATFEVEIDGLGPLDTVSPSIDTVTGTLRHTATSDLDVTVSDPAGQLRQYADLFADVELRVRLMDADGSDADAERVWKGVLTEVETQGQASATTIHTKGRGWFLDANEAIVKFENIRVWEAIEQYLEEETDFEFDVVPDPGAPMVTDELAQEASTQQEWLDLLEGEINETEPVAVEGDQLVPLQTCFPIDADGDVLPGSGGNFFGSDALTDGFGWQLTTSGQEASWEFELNHTIPSEHVKMQLRSGIEDPITTVGVEYRIDGNLVFTSQDNGGISSPSWRDEGSGALGAGGDGYDGPDLESGTHTVTAEVVEDNGDEWIDDILCVYDDRFNHAADGEGNDFDNELHEPAGHLDDPQLFPYALGFELPIVERESQVERADIVSEWTDSSGGQALGLSNDAGDNYVTEENTETLEVEFSENDLFGQQLRARVTFSRHPQDADPQNDTPRFGYLGQAVESFELRFDQTSLAVIDEQIYSESHLQNLRDLCERGRMAFTIDHSAEGKRIEVFPIGYEGDDVEWATKDWSRTDGSVEYANRIVARGARKPEEEQEDEDDLRWEAIVTDDDEIQRLLDLGAPEDKATVTETITDPEWQSQEQVNQQAFSVLEGHVESRQPSGSVDVVPTFIKPGYAYPVPEFERPDEDVPSKVLEQVQFQQSYGDASGTLQFEAVTNWVRAVNPVAQDVVSLKRLF